MLNAWAKATASLQSTLTSYNYILLFLNAYLSVWFHGKTKEAFPWDQTRFLNRNE